MKLYTLFFLLVALPGLAQDNYLLYHESVQEIEKKIIDGELNAAYQDYNVIRKTYPFMFLRDVKVASQLAIAEGNEEAALSWITYGMDKGWKWKQIRKLPMVSQLSEETQAELSSYPTTETIEEIELREHVRGMMKKDQSMAFRVLFRFPEKHKNAYILKNFVPHSEIQMIEMHEILDTYGYPGERLISENIWASTIISHHNSTTPEYVEKDTLFTTLMPKLMEALRRGEVSPFELAIMLDWRTSAIQDDCGLGFLTEVKSATLPCSNARRNSIGLRTVESRNELVRIQEKTDMNFFFEENPWLEGELEIHME